MAHSLALLQSLMETKVGTHLLGIVREVSQREKDKYHNISLKTGIYKVIQMNLFTQQKQTHKLRKPT